MTLAAFKSCFVRTVAAAALLSPLYVLGTASAGVLPDDRADALFHRYEGGGVTIQGPSVLVRKKMAEKYAVSANYYQDMITSASIDVQVSGASEYKEERDQYSLGFEYLRGKTTYNLNYTNSSENDYDAETTSFGINQDLFGDLTTVSMGFSRGSDTVGNSTDPTFAQDIDRWSYRVGVSQILTKSVITSLNLEVITDEGFLNNPYRSYRFVNPANNQLFVLAQEIYPRTRTSNAVALNGRYFLPYRAAVYGGYRFFTDTWGIRADTFELGYVHPFRQQWTFETRVRYYQQNNADFYADIFQRQNQQNFLARDKELSTFNSVAFRVGASYEFAQTGWRFIKKGTVNLFYDRIEFSYDDFRDARVSMLPTTDPNFRPAGTEPLYEFGANVIQMFVSVWFRFDPVFATHAGRASALGVAWVATCAVLACNSAAAEPFRIRDQNPLLGGFGLPSAMPTRWAAGEDRGWSGGLDLFWGSTALIQQSGSEALIVDAETREARLTLQAPISKRFAFQLQLPYRYTGAGNLDGFIDGWHDTFGLPDGARSQLPSDAINITYARNQSRPFSLTSSASGLADVQASFGYDVIASQASALSAWLSVKLPTGDADKLTGSGATDVSLILAGERSLGHDWSVFGQGAVTWLGDGELLSYRQRSVVWSGMAGLGGRVWRGLSLKAQIDAHTAAFDSDLDFLGDAIVLTVGGDYRFTSGWLMDIGVSEDIAVEHSPDVVFLLSVKRDW